MLRSWFALASVATAVAAFVACSSDGDAGDDGTIDLPRRGDGGLDGAEPDADASPPVGSLCSAETPFGEAVPVPGVTSAKNDYAARLTADELDIFFARDVPDAGLDLFSAHRSVRTASFDEPKPFTLLVTPTDDNFPSVTGDGLTLLFERKAPSGFYRLYVTTRANSLDSFGTPRELTELVSDGGAYSIGQGALLPDGSELYFISLESGGFELMRATRGTGAIFSAPVPLTELNTAEADLSPTPSGDGLVLYFGSRRGGEPVSKPYVATRANKSDSFGPARRVTELTSSDANVTDVPTWLSPDLCRLYFTSTRNGPDAHLFVAERRPVP